MDRNRRLSLMAFGTAVALALSFAAQRAGDTHCDGLAGPVVNDARRALARDQVAIALKWVRKADEAELRTAFDKTLRVRREGSQARELADRYFFETLVRLHRAGEGAPYTGLKPAGRNLGPAIPAADRALQDGSPAAVETLLTNAARAGLRQRFQAVVSRKNYPENDIAAGREYVEAYVAYVHYVERLYEAATHAASGHYPEKHEEAKATRE